MEDNVDYKELYLKMMRASEEAIRLLIQAQQDCEELYLQSTDHADLCGCRVSERLIEINCLKDILQKTPKNKKSD
ncbi:MAG: hypothetical protein E7434_03095 [Ruminococcaceae bacterium]|nr:hypothetical protein [Oscillospiraceae bacterium]